MPWLALSAFWRVIEAISSREGRHLLSELACSLEPSARLCDPAADLVGGRRDLFGRLDHLGQRHVEVLYGLVEIVLDRGVSTLVVAVTLAVSSRWATFSRTAAASLIGSRSASTVSLTPLTMV